MSGHQSSCVGTATCEGPGQLPSDNNRMSNDLITVCAVPAGMNETQAAVATLGVPGPLASKYYAMVGLAMHEALAAGGAPPPALAGTGLSNYIYVLAVTDSASADPGKPTRVSTSTQ
jgi:hypothetical protein